MLNSESIQILSLLPVKGYLSSAVLAKEAGYSSRTVRNRIKEINEELKKIAEIRAEIVSKPRFGFQLHIEGGSKEELCSRLKAANREIVPATPGERANYLLFSLLNVREYITISNLAEQMYVTESVIKTALKNTERILEQYGIKISRRPGYGLLAVGEETQMRACLVDFISPKWIRKFPYRNMEEELEKLSGIVWQLMQEQGIHVSEIAFHNFLKYIYVSVNRYLMGAGVVFAKEDQVCIDESNLRFVKKLGEKLEGLYKISLSESEMEYLAIHLAGKRVIGSGTEGNLVVSSELNELVERMIESVCDGFNLKFQENFDLCMLLKQHMVPLDIRLKYQIPLVNPLLDDIQKNYPFAYTAAERAALILQEYYGREVPADEIGYLAVIFELAMEKRQRDDKKSNILIVCSSGKGSSNLLMYKYRQEFGEYLNQIRICNLLEIKEISFDDIDYVFTTVPIRCPIPVPVYEIGVFLNAEDILNVRKVLKKGKRSIFQNYFRSELFFTDVTGETKEEVIRFLCRKSSDILKLKEEIEGPVLYREELASTDYGNMVAIPHSFHPVVEDTIVVLAVLDHPVIWGRNEVQVVLLFLIGKKEDQYLQKFYQEIMRLLLDEEAVKELIRTKSMHTFLNRI